MIAATNRDPVRATQRESSANISSDPLRIFVPHASDLLTNRQAHGDGLVAFEVASRLARRGHEVHVAAPRIDVTGDLPPTLRLHALSVPGGTSAAGRVGYMLAVRALFAKLGREGRIDIVHQLNPVFTGISLALSGTQVPIVLGSFVADWPSGMDASASGSRVARGLKRRVAALQQTQAAALLVTTPAARGRIIDARRHASKIVTLPHGIDPDLYAHAAADSARANGTAAPSILFLGGVEQRKGVFTLVEAFRRVRAAIPTARLVIAGSGSELARLGKLVASLDERDGILIMGGVARADVAGLMRDATVFCMPSFGEPFGMSLLEAMACGKPVVVTNAGGAAHLVDDDGGRRVPPGDSTALAGALIEIIASPAVAARMGAYNLQQIQTVFSWDRVIAKLESVYRSVLRGGPSA